MSVPGDFLSESFADKIYPEANAAAIKLRFQAAGARMVRVPYFLACFRVHAAQKTSAQIQSIGQAEINHLRERAQGRVIAPEALAKHPSLLRYLRRSALIEFLWTLGIRIS